MSKVPMIDSEALPSTPAHEWANETLNSVSDPSEYSLNPVTATTSPFPPAMSHSATATAASTPGFDFPGAFPKTPKDHPANTLTRAGASGIGSNFGASSDLGGLSGVLNDAKGTASGVGAGLQESLFNATVTAAGYLPPGVVEYFPGGAAIVAASKGERELGSLENTTLKDAQGISLPSEEHHLSTSSQGVGSLPGSAGEAGVAKLPLEKNSEIGDDDSSRRVDIKSPNSSLGVDDELESMTNVSTVAQPGSGNTTPAMTGARTPVTRGSLVGEENSNSLDERVPPSSSPTYTSNSDSASNKPEPTPINLTPRMHPVGSYGALLDGTPVEERANAKQKTDKDGATTSIASPVSMAPPTDADSSFSLTPNNLPQLAQVPQSDSTTAQAGHEKLASSPPSAFSATSSSLNPSSTTKTHRHTKSASESTATSTVSASDSVGNGVENGSSPQRRKTKLIDKIRGEAKILSGKIGGKEEKVEEGRRIVRGEV